MGQTPGNTPRSSPHLWRWRLATAGVLTGAFLITGAIGHSPDLEEGLMYLAFFGTLMSPFLFGTFLLIVWGIAVAVRLLARGRNVERILFTLCAVSAPILILLAYLDSSPQSYFRWLVLDPAPASLRDLRIEKWSSFSDGHAYLLAFDVAAEDFEVIRRKHGLSEVPVDWVERSQWLTHLNPNDTSEINSAFYREEGLLQRWDVYRRPAHPVYYSADRKIVVTNENRTQVYMFLDRYDRQ